MKLLDAASINPPLPATSPGANDETRWLAGYNGVSRECGVHIETEDPCPADWSVPGAGAVPIRGDVDSRKAQYWVAPFTVRGFLRQNVTCQQDDDKLWMERAFEATTEYAVSMALVVQPTSDAETWVGDPGVQSVALAGATQDQLVTACIAARKLWYQTVTTLEGKPTMHVPPSLAPLLTGKILLQTGPEEVASIWGDDVVIAPGYELATNPRVFFTPKPRIRLTTVSDEDGIRYDTRLNNYVIPANRIAAIDIPPCAIVRVGT